MSTSEPTIRRLADRLAAGVYEPGSYPAAGDMAAGTVTSHTDGTVSFVVETTVPNEDRETFTVTITRGRRP